MAGNANNSLLVSGPLAERAGANMRARPKRPASSARRAKGSMIAVPRVRGAFSAARDATALQSRSATNKRAGMMRPMPALTPQHAGLFKDEGASRGSEAPCERQFRDGDLPRDDQAARGDHDPVAILAADRVNAAQPRHRIAGIDFIKSVASLDQRAAVADLPYHPA